MERTEILVSLAVSDAVKSIAKNRKVYLNITSAIFEREKYLIFIFIYMKVNELNLKY